MIRRRATSAPATWLAGKRVTLRPLREDDFEQWREVRVANEAWLTKWEPLRPPSAPDPVRDRSAFLVRCDARRRDRQSGIGFSFGVFVGEQFSGEMNLSSIHRGAHQNAYIGYWIDERKAGNGYTPEALVVAMKFGFEDLRLHRVQVAIIPRNGASRRVVEKLALREEGVAERYLEINGTWEDHIRYAITTEEWDVRGPELVTAWID